MNVFVCVSASSSIEGLDYLHMYYIAAGANTYTRIHNTRTDTHTQHTHNTTHTTHTHTHTNTHLYAFAIDSAKFSKNLYYIWTLIMNNGQ